MGVFCPVVSIVSIGINVRESYLDSEVSRVTVIEAPCPVPSNVDPVNEHLLPKVYLKPAFDAVGDPASPVAVMPIVGICRSVNGRAARDDILGGSPTSHKPIVLSKLPWSGDAFKKVRPAGSRSVTSTLVALLGPSLLRVRVYVMVSSVERVELSTLLLNDRSAKGA